MYMKKLLNQLGGERRCIRILSAKEEQFIDSGGEERYDDEERLRCGKEAPDNTA